MSLKYLKGVATLKLDEAKCIGCGMCVQVCPHAVLEMSGRKARITDVDMCMECAPAPATAPWRRSALRKAWAARPP